MMSMIWVVLILALTGSQCGYGLPVRPTPQDYPHDGRTVLEGWATEGGLYAAIPALALVITALVLVFGCTWCYRHKDCKLFTASAQQLHAAAAQRVQPPDSGFSEPANNNISEDNNNGPISLREMQNIANNNAAAYIVSENEERNRVSRESVVEFEPLPAAIIGADPLERCADWFGEEDFPRNNLQYLREIGRGWFGRVVEGEIEEAGASTTVAVQILNQNATLEDKARFLDDAKMYRDVTHENILAFIGKCLQEDPWILMFELCTMDLQEYLIVNRPKMAILNENGVPLRLMCDVSSALAYLHSRGYTYGRLCGGSVLVRGREGEARAVLGRYSDAEPPHECFAPELRQGSLYTTSSEIWSLGSLIWEVCSWGSAASGRPSPPPDLPCPYKSHLYQVMQLCWAGAPATRPTAAQVHALVSHLRAAHAAERAQPQDHAHFEERWQRLKPNTIPKLDEHVAIVHAPSTNPRFSDFDHSTLGIDASAAVSRSSSIMSDRDPLALHVKSESLTNLHGSLDDVRNIYLTHNETAALECHQGNIQLEESREREQDRSDASMDPWLKDIIAGSQDDVSYYKDVSDVIKNLDNILNSEKTSSSESSHQASPSRDNLSLDCKKEYPLQSSLVKSPGITNFQNILDAGFGAGTEDGEPGAEDELDRDTIGTLSHSFERHSDSTSQHTLENLTPDTPMRDLEVFIDIERQATDVEISEIESQIRNEEVPEIERDAETIVDVTKTVVESVKRDTELPKLIESNVPELKELCVASMPSVSDKPSPRKDCQTPCDNVTEIRTEEETKSIDDVREIATDSTPLEVIEVTDPVDNYEQTDVQEVILPVSADEITISNEALDTLPSVTEDVSTTTHENDTSLVKLEDIGPQSMESEYNYSRDETILVSDLVDTLTDSSKDEQLKNPDEEIKVEVDLEPVAPKQMPVSVQNKTVEVPCQEPAELKTQKADSKTVEHLVVMPTHLPPEIVQNTDIDAPVTETENLVRKEVVEDIEFVYNKDSEVNNTPRSDSLVVDIQERFDDSAECMDLINNTNSQILNDSTVDNSLKEVEVKENSGGETSPTVNDSALSKYDSTQYLDLPSFDMIKKTSDFLQMEIMNTSKDVQWKLVASTPIGSDNSCDLLDSTDTVNMDETMVMIKTKIAQCEPGTSAEGKCIPDAMSPFESPSHRSHQTDTYDENSSVVLGPFENCTELFRGAKPNIDPVELPREELLAFSSNFSEINLETPSPLRDGNFLNEVPDIIPDVEHFDDVASVSEQKDAAEAPSEDTASGSGTQKHVSPSTPPNSPGVSLASTSQQKYLVDIDLSEENAPEPDSSIRSIDLNQIELQITSKLAMAENENNLNIEYSGPLTVEGLIEEGGSMPESDAVPEYYLAGNGGSVEDVAELLSLDEECVKALRNELELKLPLAQVAAIEPAGEAAPDGEVEGEAGWCAELPPPPELVVSYPGALSPIQEETGPQLSAYENDTHWNPPTRTDSSESYPEPCNNSTDSATSLPRGDTYTVQSKDLAHGPGRVAPDATHASSREITMSADSLNGSPYKSHTEPNDPLSPIDDRTYTKEEPESNCERISQVSPFLVSPTTDTDTGDATTRVSTLSRTTLPTDAKLSKPTDTQCLSKATSIDSWCSNDTLYNLEENFEDLALDEVAAGEPHSDSTDTLTHDERETSPCSTYLIHGSCSEPCETFSPDSIAAGERTYTKTKPGPVATPPGTEVDDSKNTQTKDLAYGTLMSSLPSFSNCSMEAAAGEDAWRLPQPELVRRSPVPDLDISPPKQIERESDTRSEENSSPRLATDRRFSKMESVDIPCLRDDLMDSPRGPETEPQNRVGYDDSPRYKDMVLSVTSTPVVELSADIGDAVAIPLHLPTVETGSSEILMTASNFEISEETADVPPLELDSKAKALEESEALLEAERAVSRTSNGDGSAAPERRASYSGVENLDTWQPRAQSSREKSSQSMESNISEEFRVFENSLRGRPQDLSSLVEASPRLLFGERVLAGLAPASPPDRTSHSATDTNEPMQSLHISPPSITNLIESHELVDTREPSSAFLINFDIEDETEQPHSIIVTEVPTSSIRVSPNRSADPQGEANLLNYNHTYHSHDSGDNVFGERKLNFDLPKINGETHGDQPESLLVLEKSPEIEDGSISNHKTTLESDEIEEVQSIDSNNDKPISTNPKDLLNGPTELPKSEAVQKFQIQVHLNGTSEKYATVNFLNETFEELIESSVDDSDSKDDKLIIDESPPFLETTDLTSDSEEKITSPVKENPLEILDSVPRNMSLQEEQVKSNGVLEVEGKITTVTEDFLQNEKKYATFDSYFPMLSDIRFTGPASEMMSTSFQDSPTSPTSPECEQDSKPATAAEILKEWDSDSDSHSSNSSSGEFIWKDGDGHETSVVPTTHFDHQRGSSGPAPGGNEGAGGSGATDGSGDSGSGSEGDEVEFVPSSWDCRAAPAKSSMRSLEQATPESKKRVVFKRQKYHCVYEYPREASDAPRSPACLPDLSTYCEWDPTSAEEAELCYGQLFSSPSALGAHYPLRAGGPFGPDYDEDFFITSSARPFESLGIMTTTSQFFPGAMSGKRALLERSLSDEGEFPAPVATALAPALDFTTPDSGVEDITPGSTLDDDFDPKKAEEAPWRPLDSGSSSESVSPSSPGGGELGGLRHTRDRLKLDLPPSPHAPSPRHARVFSFTLAPPAAKRRAEPATPLVMSDETPVAREPLPAPGPAASPPPEPTFSTFGKSAPRLEPAQKIVLTEAGGDAAPEPAAAAGSALDSGDEDSGIESSSKATLERAARVT